VAWREKKPTNLGQPIPPPAVVPLNERVEENPMVDMTKTSAVSRVDPGRTVVGPSLTFKGELTGGEDLLISGQVEGTVNVQGHSVTIGPEGKVKAGIHASRVIVQGRVEGNIDVQERVEIHKTGHVVGDLTAPGISIEDGAYFKGKIEIIREGEQGSAPREAFTHTEGFHPNSRPA